MNDTATGATPGTGANPDHAYPFGPAWAAYRLPCPGSNEFVTPRAAGIGFEGEPGDGSNPPAGGDPSKPTTTGTPPPATGDGQPDADGMTTDAGRRALAAERDRAKAAEERAKAAERERDELKSATDSDQEKALKQARKDTATERDQHWSGVIRSTRVESALVRAGMTNEKALALAVNAPEFASLTVAEDGTIADLGKVVDAFKADYPEMFAAPPKPGAGGQPTRGAQGNGAAPDRPKTLGEAMTAHYTGGARA